MIIKRQLEGYLKEMMTVFPVVSLTGPRQSGKTTLLRHAFPDLQYFNLERADHLQMIMDDPMGLLQRAGSGVIFDEAQRFPDLFSYIQVVSDERGTNGQYILSGSQSFLLSERISQSLAGRVAVLNLFPFDINEIDTTKQNSIYETILNGFYPRLHSKKMNPDDFYPSYIQTYIERDVRSIKSVENLQSFTRFIGLCAGRVGQILNMSSLANDAGISLNTAKSWISLLEASFIIFLLQPFYRNFNKRLIKSPKLYFYDTGVAASLLRIVDADSLSTHYLIGSLFENLVLSEILKHSYHKGKRPYAYFWRESNGTEIDCIMEQGGNRLMALEIKSGQTYSKDFLRNLKQFQPTETDDPGVKKILVYPGDISTKVEDIEIVTWQEFPKFLALL